MNLLNNLFSLMVQIPAGDGDGTAGDGSISGYGTNQAPTPPTPPANAQGAGSNNSPPAIPPTPQGTANPPPATPAATAGKQPGEQAPENVTGYGDNPPPVTPPPVTPPVTPPTNEPTKLELDLRGFSEDTVKDLLDVANEVKLTKEQAQKLIDKRKVDTDNYTKELEKRKVDHENQRQETFRKWEKELRDDPDFGGEHFAQNVHQVNKMINDHFPTIKKDLTETKSRLQPNIMRELANVAKKLYAEGNVVNGGAGPGNQEKHSPLDYYTKKT